MMVISLSNIWGGKIPTSCKFEKMQLLEGQRGEHRNAAGEKNPWMRHSWNPQAVGLTQIVFSSLLENLLFWIPRRMKVPPLPQCPDYPTRNPWEDSTSRAASPAWAVKPKLDFTECSLREKSWIKLLLSKQGDKPLISLVNLCEASFLKFNLKLRSSDLNTSGFTCHEFLSHLLRVYPQSRAFF